jgi:hypothetical protein
VRTRKPYWRLQPIGNGLTSSDATGKASSGRHLNFAASRGRAPINILKTYIEQQKTPL